VEGERWIDLVRERRIRLGREVLLLAGAPEDWIQRRVEVLEVSSRRLVRRTVGVDLVLPDAETRERLRVGDDEHAPVMIPLGLLRKEQLIDFELGEGPDPRMLVRSALNALVASGALWSVAFFVDEVPQDAADAALPWFERIVAADVEDAGRAFAELFEDGGGTVPAAAGAIAAAPETRAIAEQLRDSYILLVEAPETGARHRLLNFATDQVVGERRRAGWRERLGARPSAVTVDVPGASQAASYHAEVVVPPGAALAAVALLDGDVALPAATHVIGERATVYPRGPSPPSARLRLDIAHERSFFFLPAAVIATLGALALAAGAIVVAAGGEPEPTATAILLSGLGAVTGLVIRQGESPLTRELHGAARLVLVGVIVAALVAATAAALGAGGAALGAIWAACAVVAAAAATILWISHRGGVTVRDVKT
jgi:hypothetical protein